MPTVRPKKKLKGFKVVCPSCSFKIFHGDIYCRNCGHKLFDNVSTPPSSGKSGTIGKLCFGCGCRPPKNALFCPRCGTTLKPTTPSKSQSLPLATKKKTKYWIWIVGIFLIIFVIYGVSQIKPSPDSGRSRPKRPSLVNATVLEWQKASHSNRLKACEKMVLIAAKSDVFWRRFADNRLSYAATELETCISIAANEAPTSMRISEMGVTCLFLMKHDL